MFQKRIIVIIIIFFPLILQINPLLWVFYISLINYTFIRRREKIIIGLLLIMIISMPIFFNVQNHILGKMNVDDNLSVIVKANYYGWDSPLIEKIDKHIIEQPFTNSLFFAKALLYKKGGYFEKAEMEYNKILITGEKSGEIYNNIGNLMYFMGLYSKAEEYYQKAIEISPKLPQPYYNLAQIYIDRLDLNKSNDLMIKATGLNHDLINNFMENSVEGYYNTELIDCGVPEQYLWNEFVKRNQLANPPVIMGIQINVIVFISLVSLILSGIIGTLL
ncbi:tetratricopeptide repeat protein, partial [candidate division WOR-3 bacterium]|nr:tetratricopeptide repeat protein [candidate division WOR-3 bacterium]